jgi:ubiquinone biosynthesis protein COQ4
MGHAFAQYFVDNRIKPFESGYQVRNDTDYLVKWYRETHDLHHVVTGYRTDALGEMELQAFMAANLGLRTSLVILMFAAVLRPHGLPPMWRYFDKLKAAHARGKASVSVLRLRYERLMEVPVEAVRAQLKLPPLAPR